MFVARGWSHVCGAEGVGGEHGRGRLQRPPGGCAPPAGSWRGQPRVYVRTQRIRRMPLALRFLARGRPLAEASRGTAALSSEGVVRLAIGGGSATRPARGAFPPRGPRHLGPPARHPPGHARPGADPDRLVGGHTPKGRTARRDHLRFRPADDRRFFRRKSKPSPPLLRLLRIRPQIAANGHIRRAATKKGIAQAPNRDSCFFFTMGALSL